MSDCHSNIVINVPLHINEETVVILVINQMKFWRWKANGHTALSERRSITLFSIFVVPRPHLFVPPYRLRNNKNLIPRLV